MTARLTFPDLMLRARTFPMEVRANADRQMFTLGISIIHHFLGQGWYEDHILQDEAGSRPDGFLRLNFTPGFEGERKTARVMDFAETLFNLQNVEGFDGCVDQMRTGDIESTFAEFDFARFLYLHDIAFAFVRPSGVKGADYDFRIDYADGRRACADAKCKIEGSEMRAETIRNALVRARSHNLPADKPGIVFVKVSQAWFEDNAIRAGIRAVAENYLRNTGRLVSIVVYTTAATPFRDGNMTLMRHQYQEYPNPSHRFDLAKSWTLFKDHKVPDDWGGVHPKWARLFSQGHLMRTN